MICLLEDIGAFLEEDNGKAMKALRQICRKNYQQFSRGSDSNYFHLTVDELLSECVFKLPDYFETYIPGVYTDTALLTHVYANLKWHIWRHCRKHIAENRRQGAGGGEAMITMNNINDPNNSYGIIDDADSVQQLVDQLVGTGPGADWWRYLILMHDVHEYTFEEISRRLYADSDGRLCFARATLANWYHDARASIEARHLLGDIILGDLGPGETGTMA